MRRTFELLRAKTKYFKHVDITDVPWSERFKDLPANFPLKFLQKYPSDFRVRFTTLGCNMIKCYKHNYREDCKDQFPPTLINGEHFKCQPACYEVYQEFNNYLIDRFQLRNIDVTVPTPQEFPFETMSIEDGISGEAYCGVQLTDLKRFALLPSSRFQDPDDFTGNCLNAKTADEYLRRKFLRQPVKRRQMSGLVDTPPLEFDVAQQDVHFNHEYCSRFVKLYNEKKDRCYTEITRKLVGYLIGDTLLRQFPELTDLSFDNLPFRHVAESIGGTNGINNINPGYFESETPQVGGVSVSTKPDRLSSSLVEVVDLNASTMYSSTQQVLADTNDEEFGSVILDVAESLTVDTAVEVSLITLPRIMVKFKSNFAPHIIRHAMSSRLPAAVRISALTMRALSAKMFQLISTRMLTAFASTSSVLLGVGLITVIPDIVMSVYNVGGFNNEITRDTIREMKGTLERQMLQSVVDDWNKKMMVVKDSEGFVSPFITPEILYHMCIANFLQMYPEQRIHIGNTGVDEVELHDITIDYLGALTINSVGQVINYETPSAAIIREGHSLEKKHLLSITEGSQKVDDESHLKFYKGILSQNYDLILLEAGIICWLVSLLLFISFDIELKTLVICGTVSLLVWFTFIKCSILRLGNDPFEGILG